MGEIMGKKYGGKNNETNETVYFKALNQTMHW